MRTRPCCNEKLFCGFSFGQEERGPAGATVMRCGRTCASSTKRMWSPSSTAATGRSWTKERPVAVAGFDHNVAGGVLGLYATGAGTATFRALDDRARAGVSDTLRTRLAALTRR